MDQPGILEFLLSGKYFAAVGVALIAIVGLLRLALATKVPWFATKLGGYTLGFGSAFALYIGEALRTEVGITWGLLASAFAAGWAAGGGWEFFRDIVMAVGQSKPPSDPESLPKPGAGTTVLVAGETIKRGAMVALRPDGRGYRARAQARMLIPVFAVAALMACSSCKEGPDSRGPGQLVIDCTRLNAERIGALELELIPLIGGQSPDWASVEAKAVSAGVELGGCVLAGLVQDFLGGRKAVPAGEGWKAHNTLEHFREQHAGGATFRTARGDL